MASFECDICNYSSNVKRNYDRHVASIKHQKNKKMSDIIQKPFCCKACCRTYSQLQYLTQHEKTCITVQMEENAKKSNTELQKNKKLYDLELENIKLKYEAKIKLLENNLENLQQILAVQDSCNKKTFDILEGSNKKTIDFLEDENKFHKKLVEGSSKVVAESLSAIAYAKKHFPNAKPLVEYTDMEALKTEPGYGIAETMIFYDQNNRIAEIIGKIILNKYKENNPELQSLWNADFARVVYIVVEGEDENKHWVVDKGGVKVKSLVIDPILDHIRIKLNEYCYETAKLMGAKFDFRSNEIYHERISNSNTLIKKIDNGTTFKKIIHYLSQYLHIGEVRKIEDKQ